MFGLKTTERHALAALRFADDKQFRSAARRAAVARIPVDAPGRNTLIVRHADIPQFEGLNFTVDPIADKVSDSERAAIRRRIR